MKCPRPELLLEPWRLSAACAVWLLAALACGQEPEPAAQPEPPKRLIEREPFDQITVKDAAGVPTAFKIFPLDEKALPGRVKPEKPPATPLQIRLLDRPDEVRQVFWRDIKLDLFEELILAEAAQLVAERKTDQAYDNFEFLERNYPKTPGLDEGLQNFLFVDAGRLYGEKRYAEACAVLEELYRQNKDFRKSETSTVTSALNNVFDKILEDYAARQSYGPARTLLARWEAKYKTANLSNIARWQAEFAARAGAKRDEARELMAAGKGRAARDAARQMLDIWPTLEGGRELVAEIARKFPLVVVGVTRPSLKQDSGDLFNWPARRASRLLERNLVEYTRQGPEGGQYECPLGKISLSEDGKQLFFQLQPVPTGGALPSLTGYDVSRRLLTLANPASPEYLPAWARLMAGAEVRGVMEVEVNLLRPYISPQALLQIPLEGNGSETGLATGPYVRTESQPGETRYLPNPRYPPRATPRAEIIERHFETPYKALAALRRGEIDALDRVFPADVPALKGDKSLLVGRYELPSVHLLLPNAKRPYPANRTFRRAVLYAIDREAILRQGLLNGVNLPGCQVVSGPFSAGATESDPGGYAYNRRVEPRPYDPRLAIVLVQLSEQEIANLAKDKNEKPPPRPTLVIAHPAGEAPRLACRAMVAQLKMIGLACEARELPAGETDDPQQNYDFLYVEVVLPEPAIDARRLLGTGGAAAAGGTHVAFSLRKLEAAQNWNEARRRLLELHSMTHDEVSVLPLWQVVEHYAHQASLRGLGSKAATLYQDVEEWQIVSSEKKP